MRTKLSLCMAALVSAAVFALVPLDAADEPVAEDELVTRIYPVADIPTFQLGSSEFKPTLLIAYLKSAVDPDSWERGSIGKHETTLSLVIRQTQHNHQKIADILTSYRRTVNPRKEIEAAREVLGIDKNGNLKTTSPNPADLKQ